MREDRKGLWAAGASFLLWGLLPIYWKLLSRVPPMEIVAHRIAWSAVFVALLLIPRGQIRQVLAALGDWRVCRPYLASTLFLAANWFTYVWGVNSGHVLECSLGYFINPLITVLLGVLFLRERLASHRAAALALAAAGVAVQTARLGKIPWLALALAFTFGFYSLVRKKAGLDAMSGLFIETVLLLVPAVAYLGMLEWEVRGAFIEMGLGISCLLILSGAITSVPLLLFGYGAKRISMAALGICQYLSPSAQFVLAIFAFHERVIPVQLLTFGFIWAGIAVYVRGEVKSRTG